MKGSARIKPKDALYKVGTGIHRAVFNASKRRIFGRAFGMPIVELVLLAPAAYSRSATTWQPIWSLVRSTAMGLLRASGTALALLTGDAKAREEG